MQRHKDSKYISCVIILRKVLHSWNINVIFVVAFVPHLVVE